MTFPDLAQLNKRFGAAGRIAFRAGAGGFPVAVLAGPHGACEVALYGGQVLSYRPPGQPPALFMSRQALFEMGKPIRGGIPVCWPWFGPHPEDKTRPMHGFARLAPWTVLAAEYSAQLTDIKLGLSDSDATRAYWPHAFELTLRVTLDAALRVELTTRNRDKTPLAFTEALHTYLLVRDIAHVALSGLEDAAYLDTLTGQEHPPRKAPVRIQSETDRIYADAGATPCALHDEGLRRQITLAKRGSHATVVWNPWIDKSKRLNDFGDEEYKYMLCVETANARWPGVVLQPSEEHTLALHLRCEMRLP
jgi:D-hexose-6-phosphate mutarotase